MLRTIAVFVLLAGCSPDRFTNPEPIEAPEVEGWVVDASPVNFGSRAVFRAKIDWGRRRPNGLVITTRYDRPDSRDFFQNYESFDEIDSDEVIVAVTPNGHGVVQVDGPLYICESPFPSRPCAEVPLEPAIAVVAGGPAAGVGVVVDQLTLGVGEARPFQGVPLGLLPEDQREPGRAITPSHEDVTYQAAPANVITVDEFGILRAEGVGQGELTIRAGRESIVVPVTVQDRPLFAATPGSVKLSDRPMDPPFNEGLAPRRPTHSLALTPQGRPLVVHSPTSFEVSSRSRGLWRRPIWLSQWTGSGFGYERISRHHHDSVEPFVGVGSDGTVVTGYRDVTLEEVHVLRRAGNVRAGGWARATLPLRPVFDGPTPPRPNARLAAPMRFATFPGDAGVWVAYAFAYDMRLWGAEPADLGQTGACTRGLRLAWIPNDGDPDVSNVTMEEVDVAACTAMRDGTAPYWGHLRMAPGDGGTPVVMGTLTAANAEPEHRAFVLDGTTWREDDTQAGPAVAYSPALDRPAEIVHTEDLTWTWALPLPDGGYISGPATMEGATTHDGFGRRLPDAILAQIDRSVGLDGGSNTIWAIASDDLLAHVVSDLRPENTAFSESVWFHTVLLPRAGTLEDADERGQRIGDEPTPPRPGRVLAIPSGQTILIDDDGFVWQRNAKGTPFTLSNSGLGGDLTFAWADDDAFWAAVDVSGTSQLLRSTDGITWLSRGTLPSSAPVLHAAALGGGHHVMIFGFDGAFGVFEIRSVDASGSTLSSTAQPDGPFDGDLEVDLAKPFPVGVFPWDDGAVAVMLAQRTDGSSHALVTRRYNSLGDDVGGQAVNTNDRWRPGLGTSGDGFITILGATPNGALRFGTSTNLGQGWSLVEPPLGGSVDVVVNQLPSLTRGPGGEIAFLGTWLGPGDVRTAAISTTADGSAWSDPRAVRSWGGAWQAAWGLSAEPSGGYTAVVGDSGTFGLSYTNANHRPNRDGPVFAPVVVNYEE